MVGRADHGRPLGWFADFGFCRPSIGALIQREGGRRVLAFGMGLIAAGLVCLTLAPNPIVYLAAWVLLGLGMGAGLYGAAFAALGHLYGRDARSAVTALALWGGLASTVRWPLSAALVEWAGWRGTCLIYAGLHLTITSPLCFLVLPRGSSLPASASSARTPLPRAKLARDLRFWCLAVAGTTLAMLESLWSIHLMTILTASGYSLAAAVGLGTLIGPSQVGARLIEMVSGGRHHPIWTATGR